jgi:hypothetical protein
MKAARYLGGFIAAAALALGGLGAAQAQTGTLPTFSSGIQVQNLSSTTANITIAFYPLNNGTAAATFDGTVPANASTTYATLPSAVAAGFDGSAVISSDQRIAAVVNIVSPDLATFSTTGLGGEAYAGVTGGSTTARVPLLFKNAGGFNSFVAVQNVGSSATNITITYQNGQTQTQNNVAPGASVRFDQKLAPAATLPDGFVGAATITSSGSDIAAVVTQVGPTTVLIYNGFSAGATSPVFPLVNANNGGFITGIAIQNAGTAASDVTVSYTPSTGGNGQAQGAACTETKTIAPGASVNFAVDAFRTTVAGETCANGALFVGSARVSANTGNAPLVAIVNQLNSGTNKGGAYAAFDPTPATATVVYPLIQDRVSNFFTGISIYNAGTVATPIECTFSGSTVKQTSPAPVAPGAAFTVVQNGVIANTYTGAGVCTATAAGAKIVGIGNQLRAAGTKDTFFVYEGINN